MDDPVRLLYTPEEWVAFYAGAKNGEFQHLYNSTSHLMRDSKDPDGPYIIIPREAWRPFMDAVQVGKYDLPKIQEISILSKLQENTS